MTHMLCAILRYNRAHCVIVRPWLAMWELCGNLRDEVRLLTNGIFQKNNKKTPN